MLVLRKPPPGPWRARRRGALLPTNAAGAAASPPGTQGHGVRLRASSSWTRTPSGLSTLRTTSTATSLPAILEEAQAAWRQEEPVAFRVIHIHSPEELLDSDHPAPLPGTTLPPTVGATAERNKLLAMDEVKGDEEKNGSNELDDPTTATCISVAVPKVEEIVVFRAQDASFPVIRRKDAPTDRGGDVASSLRDMVLQHQPRLVLLLADPTFPLVELATRLETIFDKAHVLAAYGRSIRGREQIFALGGEGDAAADAGTPKETPQAVGLALFGAASLTTEDMGRLACSVFGQSWLGDFSLDEGLTRHLFVPATTTNLALGKQPACTKYQRVEETHARDLPLFRLHSVLFPGCSIILKVFEPRYRRMIKRCLEHNEPFGLLAANAAVGTLAAVTEVYRMDEGTGVSILKITGLRRFEVEGSYVADDSFGLLTATSARFFQEDPTNEDLQELQTLRVQARACLASSAAAASASSSAASMRPPPPFLQDAPAERLEVFTQESFVLSQWIVEHFQSVLPEWKKIEWLRGTSTSERFRDCVDILLSVVRRGRGGGG